MLTKNERIVVEALRRAETLEIRVPKIRGEEHTENLYLRFQTDTKTPCPRCGYRCTVVLPKTSSR